MTPLKKCTKCGEEKPATKEFYGKQVRGKYGLTSVCRTCRAIYDKKRRPPEWCIEEYKRRKDYQSEYYRMHKDVKIKRVKDWIVLNRLKHNSYCRKHMATKRQSPEYKLNAEEYAKLYMPKYRRLNKERFRNHAKESRDNLSDGYIRHRLKASIGISIYNKDIIELKRIHLTLKRKQHERKNKQSVNP